ISNAPLLKSTQSKISAEMEKSKRIEAAIEKKNELEKAAIEQEKIRLRQLMQKEETKTEVVEHVSVSADEVSFNADIENALEEAEEETISNTVATVCEPDVIYDISETVEVLESDTTAQQEFEKIKPSTESSDPNS